MSLVFCYLKNVVYNFKKKLQQKIQTFSITVDLKQFRIFMYMYNY